MFNVPIGSPGPFSQTGDDPAICLLHSKGMVDTAVATNIDSCFHDLKIKIILFVFISFENLPKASKRQETLAGDLILRLVMFQGRCWEMVWTWLLYTARVVKHVLSSSSPDITLLGVIVFYAFLLCFMIVKCRTQGPATFLLHS